MDSLIPIINDLTVIVFDLLIFTRMISLKKDTALRKVIMYLGCVLIVAAYFAATYFLGWAAAVSSVLCMSVPSLLLFFLLSKHKDSRFLMTFCFVDSVSLIIAFLGRYVGILTSDPVGVISICVTVALFSGLMILGRNSFRRYHDLLEVTGSGWREMAVSMLLIYIALVFFAAYPKPLIERLEYAPTYMVFSVVVISFFAVFIESIVKTRRIIEQNKRLEHEKHIFRIAYLDALTGLRNRASYVEQINKLQRSRQDAGLRGKQAGEDGPGGQEGGDCRPICCLMFDLNNLKEINDTGGHHMGDAALKCAALAIERAFKREDSYLFRLGGDEFCVLLVGGSGEEAKMRLGCLREELKKESETAGVTVSLAAGWAMSEASGEETIEETLKRADQKMYEDKRRQKALCAE